MEAEAEAGGASGGRKFLESLEAEAEASKMEARRRLRLRLRTVFESFIFYLKSIQNISILNFSMFLLLLLSTAHAPEYNSIQISKVFSARIFFGS